MINVKDFLDNNGNCSCYALVTYNNKIEPTYFSKIFDCNNEDWYLESPCELYPLLEIREEIIQDKNKVKKCLIEYIKDFLEDENNAENYVDEFLMPFIKGNYVYEIENFQYSPYLPKEVDDIKIVSEKEIFNFMMNEKI